MALVLKPPGSWIELQFKRAGRPRACPLGVTWLRADGGTAPYQHQLDGGGYGKGLEWESAAASKTSDLFRQVHGLEAPVSRAVCVQTVSMVPAPRGPVDVMNYFTDPGVFASDYAAMRAAMHSCVGQAEKGPWPTPATDDDTRLTLEFLVAMKPSQGILVGSSSFRVDRVAAYLSAEGDRLFYQEGLGRAAEPGEARGLADTLLAEILPAYRPPDSSCATYCRYVDDAFRVPENRRQADRAYRGLMAQAGLFWGTLLAFGAGSRGESFVARNVGIRTVWAEGRWATVLIFMDHDQLFFYGPRARRFWTLDSVPSMLVDEEYLVEMPADASDTESTFTFLDSIYRADETLREAGRAGFREALEAAYRKTRRKQQAGELRRFVTRTMVRGLTDWDECVRRFLAARASGAGESCESELRRWLAGRGYGKKSIAQYLEAMRKYTPFLAKYAFLFAAEAAARSADHG